MSYVKQNFVDGNPLMAAELNHIEAGIVELEKKLNNGAGNSGGIEVQSDWAVNDENDAAHIKNRPFYKKMSDALFDEDVTTVADENGFIAYEHPATVIDIDTVVPGDTFEVVFDGVSYLCGVNDLGYPFIGNFYLYVEQMAAAEGITPEELIAEMGQFIPEMATLAVDTGEPFFIQDVSSDTESCTGFMTRETGTYHFTVAKTEIKISNEYTPIFQADYAQNDSTAADYIKNRPFYSSIETLCDNDITATMEDGDTHGTAYMYSSILLGLNVGDTVDVVWDGVSYSLTVETLSTYKTLGNINVMNGTYSDGEVPFYIADSGSFTIFYTLEAKTYSVSITGEIVQKFSSKYIVWEDGSAPSGGSALPEVTTEDNDKVLMVVDGAWTVASIADGDEVSY